MKDITGKELKQGQKIVVADNNHANKVWLTLGEVVWIVGKGIQFKSDDGSYMKIVDTEHEVAIIDVQ